MKRFCRFSLLSFCLKVTEARLINGNNFHYRSSAFFTWDTMCSSISQFPGHFLLLDIGNPITPNCVVTIRKSLLNILSLASCLKGTSRVPVFGCGVLKPDLSVLQGWKFLKGNYVEIQEKLENMENSWIIGTKCTLGEYKHFLEESILKIVADFELKYDNWKLKTSVREQLDQKRYWPTTIVITLMTKKAVQPIKKMLENFGLVSKNLEKIEIVEVSNSETWVISDSLNVLSCSFALENIWNLDAVFKKWLLGDKSQCEQLNIVLDKKSGHHILCDLDCFIVPENMSISQTALQTGFCQTPLSHNNFISKGLKLSNWEMTVINKLKISDVCPSKLFGQAKIMYPTRGRNLRDAELQLNNQLFRALCTQLFKKQIGLLTKAGPDFNHTTALYFIISDGDKLLIRNVIPAELQLPHPASESSKMSGPANEDANFVVHSLLERIETEREISPDKCSSGIYERFKKHLRSEEVELRLAFEGFQNEKCRKIKEIASAKTCIPPGECKNQALSRNKNIKKLRKDSGHYSEGKKFPHEVIHPALLSPETTAKYRKYNAHKFLLPELLEPGVLEK